MTATVPFIDLYYGWFCNIWWTVELSANGLISFQQVSTNKIMVLRYNHKYLDKCLNKALGQDNNIRDRDEDQGTLPQD